MDKYSILLVLNLPFVIFGYAKAIIMYKTGVTQRIGLLARIAFWSFILFGLAYAEKIYEYLIRHNLTDTTPLSLADVILVTGVIFSLFLCLRLYTKIDILEKRVSDLHEKLSIESSDKND